MLKKELLVALFVLAILCTGCNDNQGSRETLANAKIAQEETDGTKNSVERIAQSAVIVSPKKIENLHVVTKDEIVRIVATSSIDQQTEIIIYKGTDELAYAAYKTADGNYLRFFEGGSYENGYEVAPFEDVLGHRGFVLIAPLGAAFEAHNYYFFDSNNTLYLLIQCTNYVVESDLNHDGSKDLIWFYHGNPDDQVGAREAFYAYSDGGSVYEVSINNLVKEKFGVRNELFYYDSSNEDLTVLFQSSEKENGNSRFLITLTSDEVIFSPLE